jgi:hypothetical protein
MVEEKMGTKTSGGEAVGEAAFRIVGEVAAIETERAVVVDMHQRRARRLR